MSIYIDRRLYLAVGQDPWVVYKVIVACELQSAGGDAGPEDAQLASPELGR